MEIEPESLPQPSRSLFKRMIRAASLDVKLFEEVQADTNANQQAFLAVILASLASAIGAIIAGLIGAVRSGLAALFFQEVLFASAWDGAASLIAIIIGWFAWSYVTHLLLTSVFKSQQTGLTRTELLRIIGFASSPVAVGFLAFVPVIGQNIPFIASGWALAAAITGARQAPGLNTGKAALACITGWIVYILVVYLVRALAVLPLFMF